MPSSTNSNSDSAPSGLPAFLASQEVLVNFFETWEAGRLSKSKWTHAAHVAVAACCAYQGDADTTFARMKAGIIRHNESVGTANTETNGYHETLTRFWASEICALVRSGQFSSRLAAVKAAVETFGNDRERFRRYFSFDVVRDIRARREWVPPDVVTE